MLITPQVDSFYHWRQCYELDMLNNDQVWGSDMKKGNVLSYSKQQKLRIFLHDQRLSLDGLGHYSSIFDARESGPPRFDLLRPS